MPNPLFDMFGMNPMVQRYMQFRQSFSGDARSQVQNLLNSGRVTQEQYNRAVQMAQQLQQMLPPSAHR
jgi:hypothetical protein